jgi:DNA-directed RNA polymerase specialized sigma24 family protein
MLEDFSPSEIAALLGLSANVVGVRLNRARGLLRDLMEQP